MFLSLATTILGLPLVWTRTCQCWQGRGFSEPPWGGGQAGGGLRGGGGIVSVLTARHPAAFNDDTFSSTPAPIANIRAVVAITIHANGDHTIHDAATLASGNYALSGFLVLAYGGEGVLSFCHGPWR